MPKHNYRLFGLLGLILLGFSHLTLAQFDYKRASLTVLIIDNPSGPGNNLLVSNAVREIEEKYNNHNIDVAVLKLPEGTSFDEENRIQGIERALKEQKIGAKMLANWFEDSLGNFSWEKVQKRGLYSARLFDFKNADRASLGKNLVKDIGKELISKTYLLILDFRNIKSTEEQANTVFNSLGMIDRRFSGLKRNVKFFGYTSQCVTYLYHLEYEREMYIKMYDNWNDKSTLLSMEIPMKLKGQEEFLAIGTEVSASSSSRKDEAFYIKKMQTYAIERAMFRYTLKHDAFATKSVVMPTADPKKKNRIQPGALIGRKESLKIDYKYIAYYRVERKDGTSFYRRKATLRADRVVDNRLISNKQDSPSRFYYDSGFNIKNGALIKEARDLGMGLSAFVANTDATYLGIRYDFNFSQFSVRMKPQLRLNLEYSQNSVTRPSPLFDRLTMHWYGLGISRQFNISKNIKTEIHCAYLWTRLSINWNEKVQQQSVGDTSGETFQAGIRLLFNVAPNTRLFLDAVGRNTGVELASQNNVDASHLAFGFRYAF